MKRFLGRLAAPAIVAGLCLAGVAVAQNVSNYMDQGGAFWHVGGTLDVKTGGKLTFNGVDVTSKLAAAVANPVASTAASVRMTSGSGALATGTLAVATWLTTITACAANIDSASTPGVGTSVVTEHWSGASATFYGWKVTNSSTTTLIADTANATIDWVCVGT